MKKKQKKQRKQNKMKPILNQITDLFSGIQIVIYMIPIFIASMIYLYITTQSLTTSMVVSIVTLYFSFYYLVVIPRKVQKETYLLKELHKYATNVTFHLKAGNNVMKSLESSKENLDPIIQKDIDKTIQKLKESAELDTEHFKKYNFYSIDVFHQILKIKYEKGGKSGDLFTRINQSINFEIVKRDELYRRKKYARQQITFMMALTLSMPVIIYAFAKKLYLTFLSLGVFSIATVVGVYVLCLVSMAFLQEASSELSLRY